MHRIEPIHLVEGTPFKIRRTPDLITLSREGWSLRGKGRTLADAEIDLIRNARDDAAYYLDRPVSSMTRQALAYRDFITRIL